MSPFIRTLTLRSLLYYAAVSVCVCFVAGYTIFQARFLIIGPRIVFANEPAVAQEHRVVTLEGAAENIVKLTLNGRQIYTNTAGHFNEALVLENGYTIATLEAHDRYGRIQTYTKEFVYTPALTR